MFKTRVRVFQSQKTQGFCVANFATLSDERRSRSKTVLLFNTEKEPCVRNFEGLARSKILGISQTDLVSFVQFLEVIAQFLRSVSL